MIYELEDATVVTLIIATADGPMQIDVAACRRPLDADDPRRPGDIIWHDADSDQGKFIAGLRAVATSLEEATR